MLLKKTDGTDTSAYRILELAEEKVLVIYIVKKSMPVWKNCNDLEGFVEVKEKRQEMVKIRILIFCRVMMQIQRRLSIRDLI